jgi:DNA-binding GntR family transcriptional regulator
VHANAVDAIRQAILSGGLPAGTHLVQSELAASLGVSVTPVREALRELAGEGLVDFDAFRGAVVHAPTLEEMDEIYSIRCALVPLAVERSVASITPADLELAVELQERMLGCADAVTWSELNRAFHRALEGPSSPHLSAMLARLSDISLVYVNLSVGAGTGDQRREDADADHRRLVEAYGHGDVALASEIAVTHLTRTIESVRRAFDDREVAAIGAHELEWT